MGKIISIDSGRSSLKIMDENFKTIRIPSVHGIVSSEFLKLQESLIKKNELIIDIPGFSIFKNNEKWIMGRGAIERLRSDQLVEVSADIEFIKNSIVYTLAALTEIVKEDEEIELITQLTVNGKKRFAKTLIAALDGVKRINRYNSTGDLQHTFEYKIKTDVKIQGLTTYFDLLFDEEGNMDEKLLRETILVVDIGSQTTDVVLVKNANLAALASFDAGSGTIFRDVSKQLGSEGFNLSAKELEYRYIDGRTEINARSKKFHIPEMMQSSADKIAQKIINFTTNEFNAEIIDKVILVGGSSFLFKDQFEKADFWQGCINPENSQFTNCSGALKHAMFKDKLEVL